MSTDSSHAVHDHQTALDFLFGRIDYERALQGVPYGRRELRLDRTRELLRRLSNPQREFRVVHVAGTKGKGSTAAMLAEILHRAGYRVGLFTSPHLEQIEERLAIVGEPCTADELVGLVQRIRPVVEAMDRAAAEDARGETGPTYFEITTALALLRFALRGVEVAILEVGLGGRLDSTNVCRPEVAAITSISLDHTRQLGNTPAAIAGEKAGIVKPGVAVVSGVTDPPARDVIRDVCRQRGSRLFELGTDFDFDYTPPRHLEQGAVPGRLDFRARLDDTRQTLAGMALSLLGRHQAANAAVALAVASVLSDKGWNVPEAAMRSGLAELQWPIRVEVVARQPAVVVDAAHNVASAAALAETLETSFSAERRWLIFATTQEKDVGGMLRALLPRFDQVVLTRYLTNPRAVPPEELETLAFQTVGRHLPAFDDPAEAWRWVRAQATADDLICITGSTFIAAEMRRLLLDTLNPPSTTNASGRREP